MDGPVRIGAVSYLNAKPLVYGLGDESGPGRLALSCSTPATLVERMRAGELDLALLPVIELGRLPDLEIVPGIGIVTFGASASVRLIARLPIEAIGSVALDPESRTSNALAEVLLDEVWQRRPRFVPGPHDLAQALVHHDAVVRIGDKALFEPLPAGTVGHDLAEVWTQRTGLPFVFAVWAARPGVLDATLYERLHRARREGLLSRDRIAEEHEWQGVRHPQIARDYLERNIRYHLGSAERMAIDRFLGAAVRLGLVARLPQLRMAPAAAAAASDELAAQQGGR